MTDLSENAQMAKARLLGMSQNELKWAQACLTQAIHDQNSNPDVGMGPSVEMILNMVTPDGITLSQHDINNIIQPYHKDLLR